MSNFEVIIEFVETILREVRGLKEEVEEIERKVNKILKLETLIEPTSMELAFSPPTAKGE